MSCNVTRIPIKELKAYTCVFLGIRSTACIYTVPRPHTDGRHLYIDARLGMHCDTNVLLIAIKQSFAWENGPAGC